jgi:hypothetical protein
VALAPTGLRAAVPLAPSIAVHRPRLKIVPYSVAQLELVHVGGSEAVRQQQCPPAVEKLEEENLEGGKLEVITN